MFLSSLIHFAAEPNLRYEFGRFISVERLPPLAPHPGGSACSNVFRIQYNPPIHLRVLFFSLPGHCNVHSAMAESGRIVVIVCGCFGRQHTQDTNILQFRFETDLNEIMCWSNTVVRPPATMSLQ